MDLLPAGPKLREAKQITWPESQFTMSLVGFEHVFTSAQPVEFAPDLMLKVISPTAPDAFERLSLLWMIHSDE